MRKSIITILLAIFLITFLSVNLYAAQRGIRVKSKSGDDFFLYKDYYALVVGVSDYEYWPDLPNAAKDAIEVGNMLKRMGFKVELITDPDSAELTNALNKLTYNFGKEENRALLFYYAGHGETEKLADGNELGYIIPRDCPFLDKDSGGFISKAISMKDIEAYSLRIRSKHVLMLFDSCFSGSLFTLVRAAPEDITEKSSYPVRQYITAGSGEETVPDNSMFKRCLMLGLQGDADLTRDGYITGTELGLYLSDKVVQATDRTQHPQYGKIRTPELSRGDFIFEIKSSQSEAVYDSSFNLNTERKRIDEERAQLEMERKRLAEELYRLELEREIAAERQQLAREKAELETRRKRLEAERQRIGTAGVQGKMTPKTKAGYSDSSITSYETGRDGVYTAYANGIVADTYSGLQWIAGPDRDMSWNEAKVWVENLNVSGGGWRLPTRKELKTLYKKGVGSRNMTHLLKNTGWYIWSGETKDSGSAWYFGFGYGGEDLGKRDDPLDSRAFAVRSRGGA